MKKLRLEDINIRDPFVLLNEGKYYMYGTRGHTCWGMANGFDVYVSEDLVFWSEPIEVFRRPDDFWADRHFWAPEVHAVNGRFYMFASFKSEAKCRGTQILVSDSAEGPFKPHSDGPVTPDDWECLDGTFCVDKDGKPHIVFCHEWVQIGDGTICEMELTPDLSAAATEPRVMFHASQASWVRSAQSAEQGSKNFVTDGPYVYHAKNGELIIIWSSFGEHGYVQATAKSDNGDITGNFKISDDLIFSENGGHGMIFEDKRGKLFLSLHSPNEYTKERPHFFEIEDCNGELIIS